MINYEMRHFVIKRQQHLIDPAHSSTAQANTIMITGIPPKYITKKALTELFAPLPGGVRKIWLNRDLKQIPKIHDARLKACQILENAETKLIKTAVEMNAKKTVDFSVLRTDRYRCDRDVIGYGAKRRSQHVRRS